MRFYEAYQKELQAEMKAKILSQEELDDVSGLEVPSQMTPDEVMEVLKGNKFRFSLATDGGH